MITNSMRYTELRIIIILLTSGFLCFVRVSLVTSSRGILFILGIILIIIPLPRPNAFSITIVILPVPGFDCSSRRHTYQLILGEHRYFFAQRVGVFPRICKSAQ